MLSKNWTVFTPSVSSEEDFEGEQIATLPELFPEDDANEIGSGEKSSGKSDADPGKEQGSIDAQGPSLITGEDEKNNKASEGSSDGTGEREEEEDEEATEEDEDGNPSDASANQPEEGVQAEDPAGALGVNGPAFYIDIPTEATTQVGGSGGQEISYHSNSPNVSSGTADEDSFAKLPVDLPPGSGSVFVIDLPEESKPSLGVGASTSSPTDEDLQPGMVFPGGAVGRPEATFVAAGDGSDQVGMSSSADAARGSGLASNEVLMHSPMKLKNLQDIVLSKDLTVLIKSTYSAPAAKLYKHLLTELGTLR